ncbi:hypothetical protein Tco_0465432 [Tanacetum coccineum]
MPFPSKAEVDRLLALPTPPSSPLISLSPPFSEERLARAAMGRLRASSPSTHHPLHPSPPLPPLPSLLYLPPPVPISLPLPSPLLPPLLASLFIPLVDRKEDIPESSTVAARPTRGHRADYGFIGTLDTTRRQRAKEVGYGIRDVWVDPTKAVEDVALTTPEGVNARVTKLAKRVSIGDCVVDGAGGFNFSRGLGTVSGIEFGSSPGAACK